MSWCRGYVRRFPMDGSDVLVSEHPKMTIFTVDSRSDVAADCPRYSVVVPVFNEAGNIAAFCRKALEQLPSGYELLICHDFDGDNTLPALAAIPQNEKPLLIRLI